MKEELPFVLEESILSCLYINWLEIAKNLVARIKMSDSENRVRRYRLAYENTILQLEALVSLTFSCKIKRIQRNSRTKATRSVNKLMSLTLPWKVFFSRETRKCLFPKKSEMNVWRHSYTLWHTVRARSLLGLVARLTAYKSTFSCLLFLFAFLYLLVMGVAWKRHILGYGWKKK